MSRTALVSKSAARDPFERLPSEVREMLITYLGSYGNFDCLCLASPIINQDRRTSKLLTCSESLDLKFGDTHGGTLAHAYMRLFVSEEGISERNLKLFCDKKLPHPLFSRRPNLVFQIDLLYQRMIDCFNRGPEIVPEFIEKYYAVSYTFMVERAFGGQGQTFPTSLKYMRGGKRGQVLRFLLLIDMMEETCMSHQITWMNNIEKPSEEQQNIGDFRVHLENAAERNAWKFAGDILDEVSDVTKMEVEMKGWQRRLPGEEAEEQMDPE
ncbi:hypothetical protein IL306_013771 [Fusarium sp. DS 682]|nr:hypothetical protein IL306_013771 [Fusarium sp. DS 682]